MAKRSMAPPKYRIYQQTYLGRPVSFFPWSFEGFIKYDIRTTLRFCYQDALFSKVTLKNEIVTYIPDYPDLFLEDIDAQVYTSRIMKENYNRMKHLEDQVNRVDIL